jgi:outer membrane receptor protein involved in Fe transport
MFVPDAILLTCNPTINSEFNGTYDGKRSEDEFTGTAKLAFAVTPEFLVYGGYDRGYKSGGFNLDRGSFDTRLLGGDGAQIEDLEFGAETVDAFELGFKSQWGRAFTLNVAAFYQDFADYQALVFSGNSFVTLNVDKTVSKGIEIEAAVRPARGFNLQLGYAYTDARYDADANLAGTPLAGEAGKQFALIPRHTVTGAATWTPAVTDSLRGLVHADFRYASEVATGTQTRGLADNEGVITVSARVGIGSADDGWRVEAFVENLFEAEYNIASFAVPEQPGTIAAFPSQPRFYGISARRAF